MAGNKVGRSPKLKNETIELLCDAIGIGATQKMACGYANVSEVTFYGWLKQGEEASEKAEMGEKLTARDKLCVKLTKSLQEAKALAGIGWLQVVNSAAQSDPAWAMKMLEKVFPDDFGNQKQRVELTGADGGPVVMVNWDAAANSD